VDEVDGVGDELTSLSAIEEKGEGVLKIHFSAASRGFSSCTARCASASGVQSGILFPTTSAVAAQVECNIPNFYKRKLEEFQRAKFQTNKNFLNCI
jgi:hypothetical protein